MQVQGFIRNAEKRTPVSKKTGRSFTVYDAEIHQDDGSKIKVSFGFDEPKVVPGDYIRADAFDKNGFLQIDQSTIQRLDPPKVQPAANSAGVSAPAAAASPAADSATGNYAVREFGYQTHPEDAKRITFSAAQDRAIKVVSLLLQHDALPHSKAKGKGGEAQRYEELMAALDKVTVKLYNDAISLRTLAVVADEGVISTKPSSNLPDDETKPATSNPLDD